MDSPKLFLQSNTVERCMSLLKTVTDQDKIEEILAKTLEFAPDNMIPDSDDYYSVLNYDLYHHILSCYKHKEDNVCLWRFVKNLSEDQLDPDDTSYPQRMLDALIRIYFYSDPLDDLTCIFIPIGNTSQIRKYLDWIKHYFYDVNYPTSLLWLYALDSSLDVLFPDEIIFLGKRIPSDDENIMIPDFDYEPSVLLKRFSDKPDHYLRLRGKPANDEFRQIFGFLRQQYRDRCLSWSGKKEQTPDKTQYRKEWEKFEDVLKFGVSDRAEKGCISFSDMRSSTKFLNTHGKTVYLNKIQQPFFESTKLISKKYNGRIDKFMGDNVMSVFLCNTMNAKTSEEKEELAISNNFFALFRLCGILLEFMTAAGVEDSGLGLRSGVTYGSYILRSNLGNEIMRDFTVTGETVNLAARLEHISIQELILHNKTFFDKAIERFPQISELKYVCGDHQNLNPETQSVIRDFTLYQNILSNLEKLDRIKFDIRCNEPFYFRLRRYFEKKGYPVSNKESADMHGYEAYDIEGTELKFHFSYYNPKGFERFEKIWILPLESDMLRYSDIEKVMKNVIISE